MDEELECRLETSRLRPREGRYVQNSNRGNYLQYNLLSHHRSRDYKSLVDVLNLHYRRRGNKDRKKQSVKLLAEDAVAPSTQKKDMRGGSILYVL